ncbi:DUF3226 domain-containing protein [Planktothrix agardhii]|uniref:DUF3226 domain-containing protein n=1 Tax=Planktothrix agardhii TaxID=1160 RepID=UPI001D09CA51|nr:DUF3226 domain-containing protein [Planktothrix agardhii]MCB8786439.1 hypothetical protein [Planktothrix agardhii 1025]MCF3611918.1 hypothetical protein [Planktothrix agardhii 1027]MCF3645693.1 hypothetical protein [Planktothrix agardhii 1026]
MSNLLIVESDNDKFFLQALIEELNYDIEIDTPIYIDDYECLGGLSEKRLVKALKSLLADIQKRQISKIGIVIDVDQKSQQERLQFIDKCLRQVFTLNNEFSDISQFITVNIPDYDCIEIACYFTHVEGKGELETVLKLIKTKESTYADCLESWRNCLENNNKSISDKEYDKFWINNYLRFDTCSRNDKKQAEKKCSTKSFEYIMKNKKDIWNFDHPVLNEIKEFLHLFVAES